MSRHDQLKEPVSKTRQQQVGHVNQNRYGISWKQYKTTWWETTDPQAIRPQPSEEEEQGQGSPIGASGSRPGYHLHWNSAPYVGYGAAPAPGSSTWTGHIAWPLLSLYSTYCMCVCARAQKHAYKNAYKHTYMSLCMKNICLALRILALYYLCRCCRWWIWVFSSNYPLLRLRYCVVVPFLFLR